MLYYYRGASAVSAAASGDAGSLLVAAERDARRIERERTAWADPLARLIRGGVALARGDRDGAVRHFASAESGFDGAQMALHAAAARRRRGELTPGDEGRALREAADAWMAGQKVRNPERMAAMLAPGQAVTGVRGHSQEHHKR
jgi:hypothetical protein